MDTRIVRRSIPAWSMVSAQNAWCSHRGTKRRVACRWTRTACAKFRCRGDSGWRPRMKTQLAIGPGRQLRFARGDDLQSRRNLGSFEFPLREVEVNLEMPRL